MTDIKRITHLLIELYFCRSAKVEQARVLTKLPLYEAGWLKKQETSHLQPDQARLVDALADVNLVLQLIN